MRKIPNLERDERVNSEKRPPRVWITWDDAYPWQTPETGGDEYVRAAMLAISEELPEWTECQFMFAGGTATALSEFIRAYEPVQSTNPDDKAADEWRLALNTVLQSAATRMRDLCAEKVIDFFGGLTSMQVNRDELAAALQSLTLERGSRNNDE